MYVCYSMPYLYHMSMKYTILTVLEKELMTGSVNGSPENCYWVHRDIEDLYSSTSDPESQNYLDLVKGDSILDVQLNDTLQALKNKYCHSVSID